ncbi:DUF2155 domain-containing protein [Paracoccus suum]|uniref:DUF2155 domain-containing protein n=2 Tax=Paracoccus suum TaxID=2259340 RepID=A0A344PNR5_9RHOB|nr:DUF2155 domain-containing protein [Paracoccus suum]
MAVLLPLPALAQDDNPPAPAPPSGAARSDAALLRGLDKITGTTRDMPLKVGEATNFGRLEVRLGECRYPADDPDSDAFAELTITDSIRKQTVFAGWMIASSPALSALDDARYDIWVVNCVTGKAPLQFEPDPVPPEDGETAADAEADLGETAPIQP